jgi:hypothetical protein
MDERIIEAGQKIASYLVDFSIEKCMGNLGNSCIDINDVTYEHYDLIQLYLDEKITSVEAIYTAMQRTENKMIK